MKKMGLHVICYIVATAFILSNSSASLGAQAPSVPVPTAVTAKIVGGYEATLFEWPWMTALVTKGQNSYFGQFCGGSLIASEWVVTAAHCVEDQTADQIDVVINQHSLKNSDGERIGVNQIYQHYLYNAGTLDNDIALLRLSTPATEETIAVVKQSDPDHLTWPFTTATILGYGDTSPGYGQYPDVLMQVDIPLLPNKIAKKIYKRSFTGSMMAAGLKVGGKDSCQGDSGGPLVVSSVDGGSYVLAGIVSWGYGCAHRGYPGLYTRVSLFADWMETIMSEPVQ